MLTLFSQRFCLALLLLLVLLRYSSHDELGVSLVLPNDLLDLDELDAEELFPSVDEVNG